MSAEEMKSRGVDTIPAELITAGGEEVVETMLKICNKIWTTVNGKKIGLGRWSSHYR